MASSAGGSMVELRPVPVAHLEPSDVRDSSSDLAIHQQERDEEEQNASSLPPVDGGKDAWLFLAAAVIIEMLIWGFPLAYGVFQSYYSTHAPFANSPGIPIIGTCAMGIMYLGCPFIFYVLQRYPWIKRPSIAIGLIIMCLSLGLSSMSNQVWQLIMSQGVGYAIGGAMAYCPTIAYMDEWFVRRKGLAFGVMWAGSGLGGIVIPLLLQFLLTEHGFRTALRAWAIILFVSTLPLAIFLKPRLPISTRANRARPASFGFIKTPTFLILQLGNIIQSLGYFIPSIYLPESTSQLPGGGGSISTLPIILFNIASVFGCIAMGIMSDRWHVTTCVLVSVVGSTLAIFLLWGLGGLHLGSVMVFALVYGLFAGSFSSTWPGVIGAVKRNMDKSRRSKDWNMSARRTGPRDDNASGSAHEVDATMVFAMLAAGRGIGNVICGPVSESLIKAGKVGAEGLYGTQYGSLVLFTGITAALSGVGILGRRLG